MTRFATKSLAWMAAVLLALALLSTCAAAQSPQHCAPRAHVLERLMGKYGEAPVALGLAGDNSSVMELFASEETGTWTVSVTLSNGLTRLIATGQNFEWLPGVGRPKGGPL